MPVTKIVSSIEKIYKDKIKYCPKEPIVHTLHRELIVPAIFCPQCGSKLLERDEHLFIIIQREKNTGDFKISLDNLINDIKKKVYSVEGNKYE